MFKIGDKVIIKWDNVKTGKEILKKSMGDRCYGIKTVTDVLPTNLYAYQLDDTFYLGEDELEYAIQPQQRINNVTPIDNERGQYDIIVMDSETGEIINTTRCNGYIIGSVTCEDNGDFEIGVQTNDVSLFEIDEIADIIANDVAEDLIDEYEHEF